MKYVAFVPARGNSKSITKKNIRPMCGRPLLYWVCKAAQECKYIEAVYVATNDTEIRDVAVHLGLSKLRVVDRDPETSADFATTESAMLDFAGRVEFEYILLVQATSPLLTAKHLDRAFEIYESGTCDSVISVTRQKRFIWHEQPDRTVVPGNYDPRSRPFRQEQDGFLVENGAFYLTSRERLIKHRCRISGRTKCIEMEPDTYFEIDEPEDWQVVENMLRIRLQKDRNGFAERCSKIRLVVTDVDGVLTDSGMYYTESADEIKKFNTRDGAAFRLLREAGILTGILTGENTQLVYRRAAKLHVDEIRQGATDKVQVMNEILARRNIEWHEVAYLGDDESDYELLKRVGVSAAPADAVPTVRDLAILNLENEGGEGALRELADAILAYRVR